MSTRLNSPSPEVVENAFDTFVNWFISYDGVEVYRRKTHLALCIRLACRYRNQQLQSVDLFSQMRSGYGAVTEQRVHDMLTALSVDHRWLKTVMDTYYERDQYRRSSEAA